MTTGLILDGVRMEIIDPESRSTPVDLIPDIDMPRQNNARTDINQSSELGDTLRELNDDTIEPHTRMSGIDMRARLHPMEITGLLGIDTLVAFRVLPESCLQFTRQKKRLSVSIKGEGRKEIAEIAAGKREHDRQSGPMGMADRLRSFVGMSPKG